MGVPLNQNKPINMEKKPLTLPTLEAREYGYRLAYQLACEQLTQIKDIEQQCLRSSTHYIDSPKGIRIEYLNQPYLISLPDIEVSQATGDDTVSIRDKLLMLHYFLQAKGTPLSNKMITYKELPEGPVYFPTYYKRTIKPIINYFGNETHRLLEIAHTLGGRQADYGDVAVTFNAFSRVPITMVIWKGDEEWSPEGSVMFDSTITDYLPTEDITILCEVITWRLVKLLKAGGDTSGNS